MFPVTQFFQVFARKRSYARRISSSQMYTKPSQSSIQTRSMYFLRYVKKEFWCTCVQRIVYNFAMQTLSVLLINKNANPTTDSD